MRAVLPVIQSSKYEYRFITVAIDDYKSHHVKGCIQHDALACDVAFLGWIDWMLIVNQIFDMTKVPKNTVDIRTYGPVKEHDLCWDESGDNPKSIRLGRLATFRILLKYRYFASWQGCVTWLDGDRSYSFDSFLDLMKIMDSALQGRKPEWPEVNLTHCVYRLAVDRYDGNEIEGGLHRVSVNYRREFSSVSELVWNLTELAETRSDEQKLTEVKLITDESLNDYRRGGKEATFALQILYREHSTWQGMLYCKDLKEERPFRSFMEMLYLMVSALDSDMAGSGGSHNSGSIDKDDRVSAG